MHKKQSPLPPAEPAVTPAQQPAPPVARLKAERVQLRVEPASQRLKAERVQERLQALPEWSVSGNAVARMRELPSPHEAAAYAGFVAQAASSAGQRVAIELAGNVVTIAVRGITRRGLTESSLAFAQALG